MLHSSVRLTFYHLLYVYTRFFFFFFNDTATTEIYTLSLHDALPICTPAGRPGTPPRARSSSSAARTAGTTRLASRCSAGADRKSTRLNSSHDQISYAVFCLKKKNRHNTKLATMHCIAVDSYTTTADR